MRCTLFILKRYLRPKCEGSFISIITWFSVIGITLGVATLIIVLAVMNGFQKELHSKILSFNSHVTLFPKIHAEYTINSLYKHASSIKGVDSTYLLLESQGLITANKKAHGIMIRGVKPSYISNRQAIFGSIEERGVFTNKHIIISKTLASHLGVGIGDTLTLIAPEGMLTPFGSMPRMVKLSVSALYDTGMYNHDMGFAFMPYSTAEVFFGHSANTIEIFLQMPDFAQTFLNKLNSCFPHDFRFVTWQTSNAPFFDAIKVEKNVMSVVLSLIIAVAAFNIISGLVILVREKNKDIAILRTLGMSASHIMRLFCLVGMSIGTLGTLLGVGLGSVFCYYIENIRMWLQSITGTQIFSPEVYFLSTLPADWQLYDTVVVAGISLSISLLASLYPAYRAGKLLPVKGLRHA